MVTRLKSDGDPPERRRSTARTPEAREDELIAAAVDLAEQQILNGTASAQVITHYLKLGSSRDRLERERIGLENGLLKAKTTQIESAANIEALYKDALSAMSSYQGHEVVEQDDVEDY